MSVALMTVSVERVEAITTNFDVTSITAYGEFGQFATGVSNGIGWTLGPTHFSLSGGATIDGTFGGSPALIWGHNSIRSCLAARSFGT